MEEGNIQDKNEELSELSEIGNAKNSLVTFAKLNKYFLIPFLCPIFCTLTNYFLGELMKSSAIKKVEFIGLIYVELSYVFGGLFHFVSYFSLKVKKEKERNSNTGITYIYNESGKNYNITKVLLLILLMGILMGINEFIIIFSRNECNNLFEFRLYFLFFIPLFSKFILKENIYKHQYLSIIIAIAGVILLIIPVCLEFQKGDIIPNILNFIAGIGYPLFLVDIKYISQKYYIAPLKLSLLFGIVSIILTCFIFIIYSLIKYHDFNYFNDMVNFSESDDKTKIIIYIIITFLFAITLRVLTLLAIFYFSPTLIIVTDIISPMLSWIIYTIQNCESIIYAIINPIGYLIVLFSSLIYNEIIIFNFCGLSKDTKKYVDLRVNEEIEQIEDALLNDNQQNNDEESLNIE